MRRRLCGFFIVPVLGSCRRAHARSRVGTGPCEMRWARAHAGPQQIENCARTDALSSSFSQVGGLHFASSSKPPTRPRPSYLCAGFVSFLSDPGAHMTSFLPNGQEAHKGIAARLMDSSYGFRFHVGSGRPWKQRISGMRAATRSSATSLFWPNHFLRG